MPNYSTMTFQFNPDTFPVDTISRLAAGIPVVRAAAALPQTAAAPIFTIAGGSVEVRSIFGVITTVIQTQANNAKLIYNPTVGADVDMCAVLDITAKAVGSMLTITGVVANAMLNAVLGLTQTQPHVMQPGTIDLSCSASNTGAVKWICLYVSREPGATIVAA